MTNAGSGPQSQHYSPGSAIPALLVFYCFSVSELTGAEDPAGDAAQIGSNASATASFPIKRFDVEGNTLLSQALLEQTLRPFLGEARTLADAQAASAALQRAFADAGYPLVQVSLPEQEVTQGVIMLKVSQGRLRAVRVTGNKHHDDANVRASLPVLDENEIPNTRMLARQLRLANENPSKQTAVEFSRGADGELSAEVQIDDRRPLRAGLQLDNSGTTDTGKQRLGVALQHANVFNRDHEVTLQYLTSPEHWDDVQVWALNFRAPIARWGDSIDLYALQSDVDAGVLQQLFNVSGRGQVAGVRYTHNIDARAAYQGRFTFGVERRAYDNDVRFGGSNASLLSDVTTRPVIVGYAASWRPGKFQVDFYSAYSRNLPGGENGRQADFAAARTNAEARFELLRAGADLRYTFERGWQARIAGEGQLTSDALVPGEQFGLGGANSVRGFEERELANDRGGRGSIELYTPEFGAHFHPRTSARALGFYDFGALHRNHALPGESTSERASSAGVGVRVQVGKRVKVDVDVATVLEGGGTRERGDDRVHASIGASF